MRFCPWAYVYSSLFCILLLCNSCCRPSVQSTSRSRRRVFCLLICHMISTNGDDDDDGSHLDTRPAVLPAGSISQYSSLHYPMHDQTTSREGEREREQLRRERKGGRLFISLASLLNKLGSSAAACAVCPCISQSDQKDRGCSWGAIIKIFKYESHEGGIRVS